MTTASIIYVDDDADDLSILKEVFDEQKQPPLLYFKDAPSVLLYLEQIKEVELLPKLIITDIHMPMMSGIELLKIIKAAPHYSAIEVIVLSTAAKREYGEECNELGAMHFLEKPSSYSEMRELTKYFLF